MLLSKTLQAVIICLLFTITSFANNIIIVESQSYHTAHSMDEEWLNIATLAGDTGAIHPQSILEDPTALAAADVLIISSAIIELEQHKINNILTFIRNGGNVYLQSEYLKSLNGNIAFQQIASNLGVAFNWEGEIPGAVKPIVLTNSLSANTPAPIEFNFFLYAGIGSGDENVEVIADYMGEGVGFSIQSPIPGQGKIITYSDQDWIRMKFNNEALVETYNFLNVAPYVAPELIIQGTNSLQCPGDINTYTAMINDIPTPNTLSWLLNGIPFGISSTTFSTAPAAGDVISASITFQKPNGAPCVVESNELVTPAFTQYNIPTIDIMADATDICGNETASFTSMATNDSNLTNYTYIWSVDGQIVSTTTSIDAQIGNITDGQIVTCQLIYDTPCKTGLTVNSNPIVMSVATPVTPTIAINGNTTICSGETIQLNASGTHLGPTPTFEWFVDGVSVSAPQLSNSFSSTSLLDGQMITCEVISNADCYTINNVTSNNIEIEISASLNPTIAITASPATCLGETITYSLTGSQWSNNAITEWFIDGVATGNNTDQLSASNFVAGQIITCELTNLSSCSTVPSLTSNALTVEYAQLITPSIDVVASPTGCVGESITFTASGMNWDNNVQLQWYVDGVPTGNNTNTLTGSNFTAGQIINCELNNLSSCYITSSIISIGLVVEFSAAIIPTLAIAASPAVCPGETITYNATGTNLDPNGQFEWFIDGVATGNNTDVFSASNFVAGQIISLELNNLSSCYSTNSVTSNNLTVSFSPAIVSTIEIAASPIVCVGESITYNATVTNLDPNGQFEWFIDGIATGNNTDEFSASNFVAGQIISCELNNLSSCYSATSINSNNLTVAFSPTIVSTIEIAASPAVCPGETITFNATGTNLDPNGQFEWFIDGVAAGNNTDEFSASNFVAGQIISCELNNVSPCYSTTPLTSNNLAVEFSPTIFPTIAINLTTIACPGEPVVFNAIGTDWDSNSQLEWFIDGVATGNTSDEFSASNFVAGQIITCELSNLSSCANTTSVLSNSVAVTFSSTIFPTIEITTNNTTICENEMATISATGDNWGPNFQLTWFVDGQMVVSGNTDLQVNITDENQVITAEIISGLSCSDGTAIPSNPVSFEFTDPAQPLVTIGVDAFNCSNNTYTILASGSNLGANPVYEWFIDDINVNNSGAILNSVIMPGQTVTVNVLTANECNNVTASSNVLPIELIEINTTITDQGDAHCAGGNGFVNLATTGGQGPYTYLWSDDNTDEFRTAIGEGNYQVTVTDINGCTDIFDVQIGTQNGPTIQDIEINEVNCGEIYGSAIIFIESTADVTINWKNENDQVLSTETTVSNLTVGKYHVEISDKNGCFDVREFEVQKMAAPTITIDRRFKITTGGSASLQPTFSATNSQMTYNWSPAIGLSCTDCANPIATPMTTTTYKLTVTTAEDCVSSTVLTIHVEETSNVYVPNIFSPNGDGINDYLLVFGGDEIVQINSMMVFNRFGETIFSKKDIQPNDESEGWDGSFKGKVVQSGVYVYFTEIEFIDGRIEIFKGDIFVNR